MYLLFYILLSGLGFGSMYAGMTGRVSPVFLLLGIIAFSVLMLMMTETGSNTEGQVVVGMNFDSNVTGTEQGTSTNVDKTGTDELVLLKLQGVEYQIWIWLHVLLILINSVFFFSYVMNEVI
jgi:hypothetical protein